MATSKLQIAVGDLLDSSFPEYRIRENYRPDWLMSSNLTRLELDFYIEELKIAFEVQGNQHHTFIPFFHANYSEFEQRKQYDREKRDLCDGAGVRLIEIFTFVDARVAVNSILEERGELTPGDWLPDNSPKNYLERVREQRQKNEKRKANKQKRQAFKELRAEQKREAKREENKVACLASIDLAPVFAYISSMPYNQQERAEADAFLRKIQKHKMRGGFLKGEALHFEFLVLGKDDAFSLSRLIATCGGELKIK